MSIFFWGKGKNFLNYVYYNVLTPKKFYDTKNLLNLYPYDTFILGFFFYIKNLKLISV